MDELLLLLPLLGCALPCGAIMWFMMRPGRKQQAGGAGMQAQQNHDTEIAALRAEVDQLRALQRNGDTVR